MVTTRSRGKATNAASPLQAITTVSRKPPSKRKRNTPTPTPAPATPAREEKKEVKRKKEKKDEEDEDEDVGLFWKKGIVFEHLLESPIRAD